MTAGRQHFNPTRKHTEALSAPVGHILSGTALGKAPEPAPDPGGRTRFQQHLPGRIAHHE